MSTEITYEKLLYAAPIVNSIRHKYGFFLTNPDHLFTLGWAEFNGTETYLKPTGEWVVARNSVWKVSGAFSKDELTLFVGSHRDIATATRRYLEASLEDATRYEVRDYQAALGMLRLERNVAFAKYTLVEKKIAALQKHPARDRLESISRKRGKKNV